MNKQDTSFSSWSELFKWASEGKPIECDNRIIYKCDDGSYGLFFNHHITAYSKHFPEKKKVKIVLFRHWYLFDGEVLYYDSVATWDELKRRDRKHLKTTIIEEFEYEE